MNRRTGGGVSDLPRWQVAFWMGARQKLNEMRKTKGDVAAVKQAAPAFDEPKCWPCTPEKLRSQTERLRLVLIH